MKEYSQKDIQQLLERVKELEETEQLYHALFDRTNDGVFLINMDGTHRTVNQKAAELLGFSRKEIEGKRVSSFIADHEQEDSMSVKEKLVAGVQIPIYERIFQRKDGTLFYGEIDVTLVRDRKGKPKYFFSIVRDVTERKQYENLLRDLAGTDSLTGLLNRRKMMEEALIEEKRSQRSGKVFTFIFLDIDLFKKINDTYGHECGDYVLVTLAQILRSKLRQQDLCCRWGGEEFLILLPETTAQGGVALAEKLRFVALDHQFIYNKTKIPVTITLGVAQWRESLTIEECVNLADIALYRGKNGGRNRTVLA